MARGRPTTESACSMCGSQLQLASVRPVLAALCFVSPSLDVLPPSGRIHDQAHRCQHGDVLHSSYADKGLGGTAVWIPILPHSAVYAKQHWHGETADAHACFSCRIPFTRAWDTPAQLAPLRTSSMTWARPPSSLPPSAPLTANVIRGCLARARLPSRASSGASICSMLLTRQQH